MLDVSKERNISFLREAVRHLQEKLLVAEKTIIELRAAKTLDDELCRRLSDDLLILRKRFFDKGRERGDRRGKAKGRKRPARLPHNQSPLGELPAGARVELDVEEVVHAAPSLTCDCSGDLRPMTGGFEESCEIDVTERRYTIQRHKRQKYICAACRAMTTAPGGAKLTPGGEFSIAMAVQVADDKFCQHLPLNRQAQQMAREGLTVDTKTLYGLTEHLAARLAAVPAMIRTEILSRPHVSIDESPMKLLASDETGYVWSISNNYGAYYQYETTRSGKVAAEMLSGFQGVVMCDGFSGYDFLGRTAGVTLAHCWAHVRRKFHDAMEDYPQAKVAVGLIDELYEVEREAKDLGDLARLRSEKSNDILARFDAYLVGLKGRYLDSSALGKAIHYYRERAVELGHFVTDVAVPIDNNAAERSQRDPVMGRNNFLGFRTINGADVAMTFYTIVRTCKLHGLSPKAYLRVMATRAARGEDVLTPLQWGQELTKAAEVALGEKALFNSTH